MTLPINKIIPSVPEVLHEGLLVLGGILVAAFVLSRFPALRQFVTNNSLTVKDQQGNLLY